LHADRDQRGQGTAIPDKCLRAGGIISAGLTAVLHGAITLKDGRVAQGDFGTYPPMRSDEVPVIERHLVRSGEAPGGGGGGGEPPSCAVGPETTNAIFAATGRRVRTLPVDAGLLKA
jgi:isoquinoline 1-oxidoreductase subunit beta